MLIAFNAYSQNQTENKVFSVAGNASPMQVDTSVITVIPYDSTLQVIFQKGEASELSKNDLETIETILISCIDKYNIDQEKRMSEIRKKYPNTKTNLILLQKYIRQYIAVTNNKGEKEVWINCFCGERGFGHPTEIIMTEDGGNCYFNLKINITNKHCYELRVNGKA